MRGGKEWSAEVTAGKGKNKITRMQVISGAGGRGGEMNVGVIRLGGLMDCVDFSGVGCVAAGA